MKWGHPRALLSLYLDDSLTPAQKTAVVRHVSQCPFCADKLERLRRLQQKMAEIPKPVPPQYLVPRIMARYKQLQLQATFWNSFEFAPKILQPAALLLALLIALLIIWAPRPESPYEQAVKTYNSIYGSPLNWTALDSDEEALRFALNQQMEILQESDDER